MSPTSRTAATLAALLLHVPAFAGRPAQEAPERLAVAFLVWDGMELIESMGPAHVFAFAPGMDEFTVAKDRTPLRSEFVTLVPEYTLDDCPEPDVIVVPGGSIWVPMTDPAYRAWLQHHVPGTTLTLTVCNGAVVLADLGLLDGHDATCGAANLDDIMLLGEGVRALANRRWVHSGNLVTSQSYLAGIDAAMYAVHVLRGDEGLRQVQDWSNADVDLARFDALHAEPGVVPVSRRREIVRLLRDDGVEAALARFRAWEASGAPAYSPPLDRFEERDLFQWMAWGQQRLGRHALALAICEFKARAWPDSADEHAHLGEAQAKAGRTREALGTLIETLERDPAHRRARRLLEELVSRPDVAPGPPLERAREILAAREEPAPADPRVAALAEYVARQFDPAGPGGVVVVARGGEPVLRVAHGLADVEHAVPLRVDQPLPIGSLTKSFTAAAVLRLAAKGALALDDDVRRHVPDAPVDGRTVTLEQLLTHTAGLPSLVDVPGFPEWAREERGTGELLARTAGVPFRFEPGAGFAYSDSGYILLGAVLEHRTGKTWDAAVRELVAAPLGLVSVRSARDSRAQAALGYERKGDGFERAEPFDWSVPHASGALVATADDLVRWVHAWSGGDVVPPELVARAWAERVLPDGTRSGYGFGWTRCDFAGQTAIQHGGWVPGFTAALLHLPDEGWTAAVLTNADGGVEASYLARRALRLVLTGAPELATYALDAVQRSALVGRYRTESGARWTVGDGEAGLVLDLGDGRPPVPLVALSPRVLCAADSDGTWCFTFEVGGDGRAASVAAALSCEPQARARRVN